jgi:putative ABC transport system ATP-binding protein
MDSRQPIISFEDVSKVYGSGEHAFKAVDGASFNIMAGELVVVLGPSGAGKSTLLNLLGGLDAPSSGAIIVGGQDIAAQSDRQLTEYRARHVGVVFQSYNLIPSLTAAENVTIVSDIVEDAVAAETALGMVGLSDHAGQFPAQLSGGEQQRVSIARAVAKNPTLLLCDEPTGALDSKTGVEVLEMLQQLSREHRRTVIIVTHNAALAEAADRVIRMRNGRIVEDACNPAPKPVGEVSW